MNSPRPQAAVRDLASRLNAVSTEALLASQGDGRHAVDASGRNRYGNRYRPEPGLLTFGSCTSSTISQEAFDQAQRLHGWLAAVGAERLPGAVDELYERVRTELAANLFFDVAGEVDVVITPSGTDAELVPLLLALRRGLPVTSILVGAQEAGSGTARAAGSRHFDAQTPAGATVEPGAMVDAALDGRVEVINVDIRLPDGTLRSVDEIDDRVESIVRAERRRGRTVLVHLIAHSKTGIHAPSQSMLERIDAEHDAVEVVVDAAQGRFSRHGLVGALRSGYLTIVTGSKFFGGPPFSGAVVVPRARYGPDPIDHVPASFDRYLTASSFPRSWVGARASLSDAEPNVGLLLRWWAALEEIRCYYSVPSQLRREVLVHFESIVRDRFATRSAIRLAAVEATIDRSAGPRLLEPNMTVFPFHCVRGDGTTVDTEQLADIRRQIRHGVPGGRPIELGQPVVLGQGDAASAVLRLALGGRQVIRTCVAGTSGRTLEERLDRLADDVAETFEALDRVVAQESTVQ